MATTLRPNSKIFIIGEAPGKDEVEQNEPFVGASGRELNQMLSDAGIRRSDCSLSNVFNQRPPNNEEEYFCVTKDQLPAGYSLPPLITKPKALYVAPQYLHNLDRLKKEIEEVRPNILLALGQTAFWALAGRTDLGSGRGVVLKSSLAPGTKLIASHHPARVLREWSLRVIAIADFVKCARESSRRDLLYDKTQIWINPTLEDLYDFERCFIKADSILATDIETFGGLIRCIGFAPSEAIALVIPFFSPKGQYWPDVQFSKALAFVKKLVQTYKVVFQNGGYDASYLIRYGIVPTKYTDDTMLLHHSLYPELRKSLEFLASIYANRPSWKKMRPRGNKTGKREE